MQLLTSGTDPVLSQVPWIQRPQAAQAETRLETREVRTDPETGEVLVKLTVKADGYLRIRAKATDPQGHEVSAVAALLSSGTDDPDRLRMFTPTQTVAVGDELSVNVFARTKPALALVTVLGSQRIMHKVVRI